MHPTKLKLVVVGVGFRKRLTHRESSRVKMDAETPPRPDGLPVIGQTLSLHRHQDNFYQHLQEEYGDVVEARLLGIGDHIYVMDPALIEEIFVTKHDSFKKADVMRDRLEHQIGDGLVLSGGEKWRRQRQQTQPAFFRRVIEGQYHDVMVDVTNESVENCVDGESFAVQDIMEPLTLDVLLRSLFGTDIDFESRGIKEAIRDTREPSKPGKQVIANAVPRWVPLPMWRRHNAGIRTCERFVNEVIARKRHEGFDGDDVDVLSLLLRATDSAGGQMTDNELRDQMMTLFFAGHETTAAALTFTWYQIARHPRVEERLCAEIDDVLGTEEPTPAHLNELEYVEATIKEAMRLHPPVPKLIRQTTELVEIGDYRFDEGEVLMPVQRAVHRDERWWPEPDAFRPERWLTPDDDRPQYAYFPFGGGPRVCIGEEFAMMEAKTVISRAFRDWTFELESPTDPDDLHTPFRVTSNPSVDVVMTARSR